MNTKSSFSATLDTGSPAPSRSTGIGRRILAPENTVKLLCLAVVLFVAGGMTARASDPVGVYAFVDKVVIEPNETVPERIQVWGGFALAEGNKGDNYATARRGYLYLKLKPGKESLCRNEWADLKSIAGTGQIVAFGTRYADKVAVRKPDAKPENPDVHPIGWGMQKVSKHDYAPIKELNVLKSAKPAGKKAK